MLELKIYNIFNEVILEKNISHFNEIMDGEKSTLSLFIEIKEWNDDTLNEYNALMNDNIKISSIEIDEDNISIATYSKYTQISNITTEYSPYYAQRVVILRFVKNIK